MDYFDIEKVSKDKPTVVAFYRKHYTITYVRDHQEFNPSGNELATLETNKHGTTKSIMEFHDCTQLQARFLMNIAKKIDPYHDIETLY